MRRIDRPAMPMTSDSGRNDFLLQQYLRAAAAATQAKDMERALAIGDEAIRSGIEHPDLLGLAARQRMRKGDVEGAYPLLLRARELAPRNATILNDLGLCLTRLGRAREALPLFDAALRQTPGTAMLHFNKALAHEQLSELDHERRQLERVVAIDPKHHAALNLLALLAADRNDDKAAREFAGRVLALSPGETLSRIALATVDVAARDYPAARSHLELLLRNARLDPDNRSIAQTLMGDVLDGEGKYVDAFGFYAASKETLKAHYARAHADRKSESVHDLVERLGAYFRTAPPEAWQARKHDASGHDSSRHVFLVGFLRSGTTLLGQVLAGHPQIEVMQERECLDAAIRDFVAPSDGLDRLATLSDEALEPYRKAYWQKAREFGHMAERKMFVDKTPLATIHLPLVAKLFPGAKVLFAYRDPRDVVLSCFRRRFSMSDQKYEMLSLDNIAAYYAGVVSLSDIYREKLGLEFFEARHETLTSEFEAQTKRICEFLGIAWDAAMSDFASRARAFNIDIPNSAQIARGLSRDGEGLWRRYERELAPVLPILAPWCARFGYPEN
jgi:tetratricopeptide (TPR) repeat protein